MTAHMPRAKRAAWRLPAAALAALVLATSAAAEEPPPGPPAAELSARDREAVAELLADFAKAMLAGSVDDFGSILSPDMSETRRDTILDNMASEFKNFRYEEYRLSFDDKVITSLTEDGSVRLESVPAEYRYVSTSAGVGAAAAEDKNAYSFTLARVGERWYVADSDLFSQTTTVTPATLFSTLFFVLAILAVTVFFWGWMLLDCSMRFRSWKYSLALLLTPPLGPLYYFFAVWLRTPADEIGE